MANTIRTKSSTGSSAPTSLANAELAHAEGSDILFIGKGTGGAGGSATTIEKVGGKGAFWDGGIIDYHFDLTRLPEDQVWLYPHFNSRTTVGWFDKFLPWRANQQVSADQLIMICPSDEFLAQLPFGKIPDRRDFGKIPERVRETYWRHCVK